MSGKVSDIVCPVPIMKHDTIQLAHGSGGRLSAELVEKFFLPFFDNTILNKLDDQAVVKLPAGRVAFTTDAFVVEPLFFPGGNIGDLAVNGTVNDVCMSGAQPLYISASFIIEEGFSFDKLRQILESMKIAAEKAGVSIVTGDTKVVNKGCCDGMFITTSGIGTVPDDLDISASNIKAGDKIILSGSVADHGMAVMTTRENLSIQTSISSDSMSLNGLVNTMLQVSRNIHAMRDPTRGGVATTLNEFARASQVGIEIVEEVIPLVPQVRGACEVLGIDPLYVANEGKLIAAVPADIAERMVAEMRRSDEGKDSVIIGEVVADHPSIVTAKTGLGVNRILDMPLGEQLPRIC